MSDHVLSASARVFGRDILNCLLDIRCEIQRSSHLGYDYKHDEIILGNNLFSFSGMITCVT